MAGSLNTLLQTGLALGLVALCMAYAVWQLMPKVLRKRLAAAALRVLPSLPLPLRRRLERVSQAATGGHCGGCDGCDGNASEQRQTQTGPQPLVFFPRQKK